MLFVRTVSVILRNTLPAPCYPEDPLLPHVILRSFFSSCHPEERSDEGSSPSGSQKGSFAPLRMTGYQNYRMTG